MQCLHQGQGLLAARIQCQQKDPSSSIAANSPSAWCMMGCTWGRIQGLEAKPPLLLVSIASAAPSSTCAMAAAGRTFPCISQCIRIFFVCVLDGKFSGKGLGLVIVS